MQAIRRVVQSGAILVGGRSTLTGRPTSEHSAIAVIEELLLVVLAVLIDVHDAEDASAQALAGLLGLVAVVGGVSAAVVAHYA